MVPACEEPDEDSKARDCNCNFGSFGNSPESTRSRTSSPLPGLLAETKAEEASKSAGRKSPKSNGGKQGATSPRGRSPLKTPRRTVAFTDSVEEVKTCRIDDGLKYRGAKQPASPEKPASPSTAAHVVIEAAVSSSVPDTAVFACVRLFAGVLWFMCHTWPRVFLRWVPRGGSALSLAIFYFYAQALGLLWVFFVSLLAALTMNVLQVVVGEGDGSSGVGAENDGAMRPLRTLVIVYLYHCLCRVLVLGSGTMWMVMWETYHDFPTMRRMMLGRNRNSPSPERVPVAAGVDGKPSRFGRQTSPEGSVEALYIARRSIVLSTPLVVLNCLNLAILVGQGLCEGHLEDRCSGMAFLNPTSRINRNLRFVLFVAMLQWLQAWTGLFPYWHVALKQSKSWCATFAVWILIFGLLPSSLLRLVVWLLNPAGTGVSQYMIFGLRHFFVDALLVSGWSLWLLVASTMIVFRRELLHVSGFSTRMITDDEIWHTLTGSFKFTLAIWELIAFLRGVAKLGFAHGQSDWVFITMLYPWLLALIWTITFILVALARYGLRFRTIALSFSVGAAICVAAARLLCSIADRSGHHLLVAFVTVYLARQAFHGVRKLMRQATSTEGAASPTSQPASLDTRKSIAFCVSNSETMESSQSERRLARGAVQVLLLICFTFILVLTACVVLGGLQQRAGLFIEDVMYWKSETGAITVTNAEVSRIRLGTAADNASALVDPSDSALPLGVQPRYAVCGHQWHGLSLLDYSLLASVSYMSNTPRNDLPGLFRKLMPRRHVTVRNTTSSSRKWLDMEVQSCKTDGREGQRSCQNVTVISISGTDPTRFGDYAENIRMWTEPVALQILSALFPSVRTWPRDTTAEVISLMHSTLESLAIQDDRWQYQEVLSYLRGKSPEEEVVLTGHSLGGGMALVVGALTGRLAVAIQPPGVYHSLAKHQQHYNKRRQTGDTTVHQRSVTLKFEGDWVQHFDEHGGLVQTMSCDRSHQGVQLACHMLEGAICHLVRHCGDDAQRFTSCRHDYTMQSAAETVWRVVWTSLKGHWRSAGWRAYDAYANVGPSLRTALCVAIVAVMRQIPRMRETRRLARRTLFGAAG